jgi:hypothetical protein
MKEYIKIFYSINQKYVGSEVKLGKDRMSM